MYTDTAGNAMTYEATNKPDETCKSGQKRVYFPMIRIILVVTSALGKLATLKVSCYMSVSTPLVD